MDNYVKGWVWLCSKKTLFTQTGGGPDFPCRMRLADSWCDLLGIRTVAPRPSCRPDLIFCLPIGNLSMASHLFLQKVVLDHHIKTLSYFLKYTGPGSSLELKTASLETEVSTVNIALSYMSSSPVLTWSQTTVQREYEWKPCTLTFLYVNGKKCLLSISLNCIREMKAKVGQHSSFHHTFHFRSP